MSEHHSRHYSEEGTLLGKGAYGVVTKVEALKDVNKNVKKGQNVAVKKIEGIFSNRQEAKRLLRELNILQLFRGHNSMVQLLDIIPPSDDRNFNQLSLVFECVEADLKQVLKSNQQFTSLHIEYILYQLCNACFYMHSAGIVHRDLKPANILINCDCTIKICDFGLARGICDDEGSNASDLLHMKSGEECENSEMDSSLELSSDNKKNENGLKSLTNSKHLSNPLEKQRQPTKHVVTRWYRAPEVILLQLKQEHLPAIDMWSIGCISGELLQMNHRFCNDYTQRKCLFPGTTCWPLSGKDSFSESDRSDQLNVIFSKLGSPTLEELEKIENPRFKEMAKSITAPPSPIQEIFPAFPLDHDDCKKYIKSEKKIRHAIDFMLRLLQFDVEKRATAELALKHKYFARVKEPQLEVQHKPVRFEFEHQTLNRNQIRDKIINIVNTFNDQNK